MPRPNLTRFAAACTAIVPATVVVQAPAPAGADDPLLIEVCTTETIPVEDVQEGATVEIFCDWVDPGELAGRLLSSTHVATHYDGTSGNGSFLEVSGNCGESISFDSADPWNNVISSTRHFACGTIKHFTGANLNGTQENTTGSSGMLKNLTVIGNQVSSVGYDT